MFSYLLSKWQKPLCASSEVHIKSVLQYISSSYPSNHNYSIVKGQCIPKRKLAARYKIIRTLFPEPLTSLADLGCSKGFFVFSASAHPQCIRTLGIDVNEHDIQVCRTLSEYLKNDRVCFEKYRLHELVQHIEEHGGPFQTVLIINQYQYLFFGSDTFPDAYLDHDIIFRDLRKICSQRIIFNNRIDLQDCQNTARIQAASDFRAIYTEEKVREAASRYFRVVKHGTLGRYPLWTLHV